MVMEYLDSSRDSTLVVHALILIHKIIYTREIELQHFYEMQICERLTNLINTASIQKEYVPIK